MDRLFQITFSLRPKNRCNHHSEPTASMDFSRSGSITQFVCKTLNDPYLGELFFVRYYEHLVDKDTKCKNWWVKSWNLTENLLIKTWPFNPCRTPSTTITVGDINWRIERLISSKYKGTSEETGEIHSNRKTVDGLRYIFDEHV